jgi:CP family cyanate transporter-like MFS transporter
MTEVRPLWRGRALTLIGIAMLAFSLRTAVASLSPLLGHIANDFELPAVVIGLIAAAPPICFAVFALVTPPLSARFGLERVSTASIVVIAAGLFARGIVPDALWLLLVTAAIFAGVGVGNVVLPPLVNKYFPDRLGTVVTLYSTMLALSTFLPPLFAVPLAEATSWRFSVSLWGYFALLAILPWLVLLMRERKAKATPAETETVPEAAPEYFWRLWKLKLTWAITAVFVASAVLAYVGFAWLPTVLIQHVGVSEAEAGTMLSLFAMIGLPSSLVVPVLMVRFGMTRSLFLISTIATVTGITGLIVAPHAALLLWIVLFGLYGMLFPMSLALISIRARDHISAVALSGFAQSIGYAVSAVFPFIFGILGEETGGWTIPLVMLIVIMLIAIPAGLISARPQTVEDEWERRYGKW